MFKIQFLNFQQILITKTYLDRVVALMVALVEALVYGDGDDDDELVVLDELGMLGCAHELGDVLELQSVHFRRSKCTKLCKFR